jgi:O-antigen ligase
LPTRSFSNAILWLAVFLGGFVFIEPAPYDVFLALTIPLWMIVGMTVPRAIGPLILLMMLFCVGGILATTQAAHFEAQPMYMAVTAFLALSACFFACLIAEEPKRLDLITRAWIAAAAVTSILGVCGYFGLTGDWFVRFGRATGGFEDPNVFGPFLVFPFLVLAHRALTGSAGQVVGSVVLAVVIFAGIFLSFSRATWGMTVVSVLMLGMLLYVTARTPMMRARYIVTGVAGLMLMGLLIAVALSLPAVSELFAERAQVVQDYDSGRMGRFERHAAGFNMMLDHPLGIGAMEFGKIFREDEHNIWLKALTTYGWLGFAAFFTLVLWTLVAAFPLLFRTSRIQAITQIAYVVFVCHIIMALVIDIDHWRHVFVLFGILWGAIAASPRRVAVDRASFEGAAAIRPPRPAF